MARKCAMAQSLPLSEPWPDTIMLQGGHFRDVSADGELATPELATASAVSCLWETA